jgi:cupin superfamily acireductone dioxygenase involved in methionine salvage
MTDNPRLLTDPYKEWLEEQSLPVIEDFGVDLLEVPTEPWSRLGANAAFVNLKGRGDFISVTVVEVPPVGATEPQRHLYEEVVYILSGHGSTAVESADGKRKHSFEWGPKSLFALPLNARYRHFNTSGSKPVRFASTSNLPMQLNLFHNREFIFDNPWSFEERLGTDSHFAGEGDFIPTRPGRHMWATNFVPDLGAFELRKWEARGAGGSNMMFVLADGTMHAHISEMPVGTYKKGHRHGADFHVFAVTGRGYSLLWYEGDDDFHRVDWRHGVVYAPPDQMFHQHFNTSPEPARYLAVAFGGLRYPFTEDKRRTFMGMDVSVRDGGRQIEYEDEDPRIRELYGAELAAAGIEMRMEQFHKVGA